MLKDFSKYFSLFDAVALSILVGIGIVVDIYVYHYGAYRIVQDICSYLSIFCFFRCIAIALRVR